MFGSNKRHRKASQSSPNMIYLPHDIFKHVLSFKDPRYERVMHGNPYMATPTRVFVITKKEFHRYNKVLPWLQRIEFERHHEGPDELPKILHKVHYYRDTERNLRLDSMWHIRRLEAKMHPQDYYRKPDDAIKCSYKAIEMSLQCEACGPDLELYQRRR